MHNGPAMIREKSTTRIPSSGGGLGAMTRTYAGNAMTDRLTAPRFIRS